MKPSELYHSIQGHKKSNLIFKIPSYNKSSWISETINLNDKGHGIHNEFIVKFTNLSNGDDLVKIILRRKKRKDFFDFVLENDFKWVWEMFQIESKLLSERLRIENKKKKKIT